ncbi:DUF742 domain-containing protein [Micromonospora sp. KC213]|uniref:DUF742 domain-containing protein n=1 Tax=Micromonospora sp. KC213 TaxID=2530378 RepID=UPI001042AF69|nr:DUF742 domain-containing protein [Micromonospora sp. KC213]TDC32336.1 DUF742 domain-containing protein [Micromonospora sp. KC213]
MTRPAVGEEPDPEPLVRIRPYLGVPEPPGQDVPMPEPDTDRPAGPRPFVLTAGRVAGTDPAIGLETQVTARGADGPPATGLAPELQMIIALCAEPTSVAELSARARLHVGVTRVLVGDLRAAGHLDVHDGDVTDAPAPDLILRVIDGLRAIS